MARDARHGFTLIEVALTLALVGTLAALGTVGYRGFVERARLAQVVVDLKNISIAVDGHEAATGSLPDTLADAGMGGMTDIWGNPYVYLRLDTAKKGKARKDKFLVPINSDYDLYSMGPDGKSVAPLTAKASRDDMIRAADGSYYGPAAGF